ncbi:MAG: hypothetical protein K2X74_11755 [Acetobacteraceae bacterium]|nr:hypothetical protein [Acetobacteraceae bacterium]
MSRLRAVAAGRQVLPAGFDLPRVRSRPVWLPDAKSVRETAFVWLMRAGMLAYMLVIVKLMEVAILAVQRWL